MVWDEESHKSTSRVEASKVRIGLTELPWNAN
jgi:hypothetical protein